MDEVRSDRRLRLLIASPLEREQIDRIRDFAPDRVEVMFEPALLPMPRYVADHHGIVPPLDDAGRKRWLDLLARADISFDFDWLDPSAMPQNAPRLRWVQATSAGIGEFLRSTGLETSSIQFTTASGVHARPLAEWVVLSLLYFTRRVSHLQRMMRERRWERFTNRGLEGMRVLVVGLGSIGGEAARQCAGLGMEVWGMSRTGRGNPGDGIARLISHDELLAALGQIDALVLACPLTNATVGLIGCREIEAIKPGALFINIARGAVVDEPALIAALESGRLGGAALDVVAVEPLPGDSPLWDMENVLISPHSASTVETENARIVDILLDNLGRFLDGRPLVNLFDRDRGY